MRASSVLSWSNRTVGEWPSILNLTWSAVVSHDRRSVTTAGERPLGVQRPHLQLHQQHLHSQRLGQQPRHQLQQLPAVRRHACQPPAPQLGPPAKWHHHRSECCSPPRGTNQSAPAQQLQQLQRWRVKVDTLRCRSVATSGQAARVGMRWYTQSDWSAPGSTAAIRGRLGGDWTGAEGWSQFKNTGLSGDVPAWLSWMTWGGEYAHSAMAGHQTWQEVLQSQVDWGGLGVTGRVGVKWGDTQRLEAGVGNWGQQIGRAHV